MHFVSDLHLHSKYSRAVSKNMTLPVMAQFAVQKGIDILTAADWTHPLWFKELRTQLEEAGDGLYKLKTPSFANASTIAKASLDKSEGNQNSKLEKDIYFLLSTEISSIYKQGEKVRRIHNLVFVPGLEVAGKVNKELLRRGCNLSSDGRPIIGLSSKNLLELILSVDERCFLIPCHIWTPHFGIYGSASGFNSLEEAFGDLASHIYGIETGLSSDPDMNWQVQELKYRTILSFSDAHSPAKIGREVTVFNLEEAGYENIRSAIMRLSKGDRRDKEDPSHIVYTIEFYPEEGKYHFSGHRNCKVVLGPEEIEAGGNICPVCHRRLTEGVLSRVRQLAQKELLYRASEQKNTQGFKWFTDNLQIQPPYVKMVPLLEVIAGGMSSTVLSKKVQEMYARLISQVGPEFYILLKASVADIQKVAGVRVAKAVTKVRGGELSIDPGFDGVFGKVKIFDKRL